MIDHLEIGPVPAEENCAQVGEENYMRKSIIECGVYVDQLNRQFGHLNKIIFIPKSFPHDFGTYMEVVIVYDDEDEESTDNAFYVENNLPDRWDDTALALLNEKLSRLQ